MPFEGGERPALVGGDPDVDHRDLAAGVERAGRTLAGVVGDADDLRLAVLAEAQHRFVVDVPLHERPAPVDELGVVDGEVLGDEHRRDQRPLLAVDGEDERFRPGGVEEVVVDDEAAG